MYEFLVVHEICSLGNGTVPLLTKTNPGKEAPSMVHIPIVRPFVMVRLPCGKVRKLSLNMTIVAIGEDGDWLQVVPDAPSGPGTAPGNRGEGNWSSPTSFYGSVPGSEDSANPSNARASAQLMGSGCVAAGANNEASSSMTSAGVFLPFSGRNSKDGSSASQTSLHGFGQDARGNAEGNPEEQPALWALRRHGDKLYLVSRS